MKQLIVLLLCLFFLLSTGTAQNKQTFKLSGSVADSSSGAGLQDVNILILSRADNSMLSGTSTLKDGSFSAEDISEKNVRVKFSIVGYQTKVIDSVSLESAPRMGLIKMRAASVIMPEVVIKTIKPMIEYHVDKQVINLDQVPGGSGSVVDAVRNSGAVEVEPATNKITVRGQDVKIQMDGQPYNMPDNMLAQMPASMFEQAEVITSPSAKESAEGGAYILNLITKKGILDSYNGSVSLNTSTRNQNFGGINFNYKKDEFNAFTSLFGGLGSFKSFINNEQINYRSSALHHLYSGGVEDFEGYGGYAKLGFDYNPDEMNMFTFYGSYNRFRYEAGMNSHNEVSGLNDEYLYSYENSNNSLYKYNNITFYGFHKHKYNKQGRELTLDALFYSIGSPNSSDMNVNYSNISAPQLHNRTTEEDAVTVIAKADYVHPSEAGKFETGYNFTYRKRDNDYHAGDYSYTTGLWTDGQQLSNLFKYNEDIHALYLTYSNTFGNIDIKTGLRAENLATKGEQITTNEYFSKNFFNLFPNLNIAYKFTEQLQLGFNAFRRVRYPQLYFVNPFKQFNGPNNYSIGNPQIQPYFINSYAFNFSQFMEVYYVYSTGLFNFVTSVVDDSVTVRSPINISNNKTYGIELKLPYYNSPAMPVHLPDFITMMNIQFGYNYRKQEGYYLNEDLNYGGHYRWLSVNLGLKLWYDINSNIYYRWNPRSETRRSINDGYQMLSLSFTKSFMDQKLLLSLSVSDLLNSQKFISQTYGTGFWSRSEYSQYRSRSVQFGITYRINDYKERRDRSIDDGRDASDKAKF